MWALRREGVAKGVTVAAEVGAVSERAVVDASAEVVAVDGAMAGTSAPSPSSLWFCTRLPPPSHSPRLSPCPPVLSSLHSALPLHPWTARPPLRLLELGPSPGGGVVVSLRWRGGGRGPPACLYARRPHDEGEQPSQIGLVQVFVVLQQPAPRAEDVHESSGASCRLGAFVDEPFHEFAQFHFASRVRPACPRRPDHRLFPSQPRCRAARPRAVCPF